jgi:hypothetical protein
MTPLQLSVSELMSAGSDWFTLLGTEAAAATSDEAKRAWTALSGRGYAGAPATKTEDKARAAAHSHHARGKALYDAFVQTDGGRIGAGTKRRQEKERTDKQTLALRNWLRATHAEIIAIKRGTDSAALAGLPTLGELATASGLLNSAQDFLAYFGNTDVQAALAPFALGQSDLESGKRLLQAWQQSRGELVVARGSETTTTRNNVGVREEFAAWLSVWWAIAKVRLKDQPGVLTSLGVVTGARRRRKPTAVAPVPVPVAPI